MKKLVLVLLVAVLSVPAFAAPALTLVAGGPGQAVLGYTADAGDLISGMGITISVDNGAKITAFTNGASKYWVHPKNIVITSGALVSQGSPIVGGTAVLPTASIVVEYGALYKRNASPVDPNKPAVSGTLCTITVDKNCTVTATANHAGGVVTEAYVASAPSKTLAVTVATVPACTLALRWSKGDVAGGPPTFGPDGKVDSKDLNLIIKAGNWGQNTTNHPTAPGTADICADIAGGPPTFGPDKKVDSKDLNIVIKASNWGCPTSAGCTW